MEIKALAQALQTARFDIYTNGRSDAQSRAVDCLSGRTHYVDADTRRYFRARVLSSTVLCDGLFFGIVESASGDHEHKTRIFRGVIFDIFGTVVSRPPLKDSHKSRMAATREFWRSVDALNPCEHYRGILTDKAKKLHADSLALMQIVVSMGVE